MKRSEPGLPVGAFGVKFAFNEAIIEVNMPSRAALFQEVRQRLDTRTGFALATINLDHIAKMSNSDSFVSDYARQDLIVADGWPIVALSRLAGTPVTLMPGSDLILPLCQLAAEMGVAIALVGGTERALLDAKQALERKVPKLKVVLTVSPMMGFDPNGAEAKDLIGEIRQSGAQICFLAFGAPKQEALAARARDLAPHVGFVSIGAGLDFLGGHQHRAPRWVRRFGMEWFWRAMSSPRRLVPRYVRCFAVLPGRVAEALRHRRA